MNTCVAYDHEFYARQVEGSKRTARIVAGLLSDLLAPRSVVDLGCGMGGWLRAFQDAGAEKVSGFDGDYIDRSRLLIDAANFEVADLSKPLRLPVRFDLAVSLEVAEHIDPESAPIFVESLVSASDIVLFAAAIPFQGGAGHVNEQWQSYWACLFGQHGYQAVDIVRPRLWNIPDIPYWYASNTLLYVAPLALEQTPELSAVASDTTGLPLDVVHPRAYEALVDPDRISIRRAGRNLGRAIQRRLGSLRTS